MSDSHEKIWSAASACLKEVEEVAGVVASPAALRGVHPGAKDRPKRFHLSHVSSNTPLREAVSRLVRLVERTDNEAPCRKVATRKDASIVDDISGTIDQVAEAIEYALVRFGAAVASTRPRSRGESWSLHVDTSQCIGRWRRGDEVSPISVAVGSMLERALENAGLPGEERRVLAQTVIGSWRDKGSAAIVVPGFSWERQHGQLLLVARRHADLEPVRPAPPGDVAMEGLMEAASRDSKFGKEHAGLRSIVERVFIIMAAARRETWPMLAQAVYGLNKALWECRGDKLWERLYSCFVEMRDVCAKECGMVPEYGSVSRGGAWTVPVWSQHGAQIGHIVPEVTGKPPIIVTVRGVRMVQGTLRMHLLEPVRVRVDYRPYGPQGDSAEVHQLRVIEMGEDGALANAARGGKERIGQGTVRLQIGDVTLRKRCVEEVDPLSEVRSEAFLAYVRHD